MVTVSGDRPVVAVLGGASIGTVHLLDALHASVERRQLPPIKLRLYGRDAQALQRVVDFGIARARSTHVRVPDGWIEFETSNDLARCLGGATIVLSQVRPGGMKARALDEVLPISFGIPGDEGLGPSGLACFLRTQVEMDLLFEAASKHCPDAVVLQMTSPLGLNVARARAHFCLDSYGVCELPLTTARRVRMHVEDRLGCGTLTPCCAGLNHQSWLYRFLDRSGFDRTSEVLSALNDPSIVDVDPEVMQRAGAVPMPYLKLIFHADRELARQRAAPVPRGVVLHSWLVRAQLALNRLQTGACADFEPILAERRVDWYHEAVIPVLAAFLAPVETVLPLNLPSNGALPGAEDSAIVELPASICALRARPIAVPALPDVPMKLTTRLLRYEVAALALSAASSASQIADVLMLHPMVPEERVAMPLAQALKARVAVA